MTTSLPSKIAQPNAVATSQTSLQSATPSLNALADWGLGEPIPDPLPPALCREPRRRAIAALETATAPADPRALAVALDDLMDHAETFGWGVSNRRAVLSAYLDVMAAVPSDLVIEAVRTAKREWRANRLPTPANLYDFIKPELGRRTFALLRLRRLESKEKPNRNREAKPDPAKAQRAAAETKAAARSTRTPRAPGMTDADLKRAQDEWNREAQRVVAESREDAA